MATQGGVELHDDWMAPSGSGGAGSGSAKEAVKEYANGLAMTLGPKGIRVNVVHPGLPSGVRKGNV